MTSTAWFKVKRHLADQLNPTLFRWHASDSGPGFCCINSTTSMQRLDFNDMVVSDISMRMLRRLTHDIPTALAPTQPQSHSPYVISVLGRTCIGHKRCMFIDHMSEIHIFVYESTQTSKGVEIYWVDPFEPTYILAHAFFYMEHNLDTRIYNPYIVLCPPDTSPWELLTRQRGEAAHKIATAFLSAKYNPEYTFCRTSLLRDMQNLEIHETHKDESTTFKNG
jgi:hypothetical protein